MCYSKRNDNENNLFMAIQPGSIVLITNIWVMGPEGKDIKTDPLEYLII